MKSILFQALKENDVNHWWYKGRRTIINSLIESKLKLNNNPQILDAGCGYGGNIEMLKKYGEVWAMDIDWEVIKDIKVEHKLVSKIPDKLEKQYDLILLTDVLEHIENDSCVSTWIKEALTPGGYAIITVPALKILWSKMDDDVGHFRRYAKAGLLNLFKNRLNIVYCSYYNFFLFPTKLISKSDKVNELTYKKLGILGDIFFIVMKIESMLLKFIKFPIGVSLILIVKKDY